jgi:transposase
LVALSALLPIAHLQLEAVDVEAQRVTIVARATRQAAVCPACQYPSTRIHSHYTRTIADLPCVGRTLILSLRVRRFFCDAPHCPQKTFAERFGPELPAYARRTTRLTEALRTLAFATSAQGGARVAHVLTMPVSPRTLLRLMHTQPDPVPVFAHPQVVGIDDWAWKKGASYGTICVDLERRQPIDLLPDRAPDSITAWFAARPTIDVIARDRGAMYIDGATRGAPRAQQVADRWHLLKNLGEALEYFFLHHKSLLKATAEHLTTVQQAVQVPLRPMPTLDGTTNQARAEAAGDHRHARAVAIYEQVHARRAKQVDVANIARQVGVSRRTVYRYLHMSQPPARRQLAVGRPHVIEPYAPYLVERWNDGCRNATQMWRELREQGYPHALRTVVRFVGQLRQDSGVAYKFCQLPPTPIYTMEHERKRPLTALQAARLWTCPPEQRSPWQDAYVTHLCATQEIMARTFAQVQTFVEIVRQPQGERFDAWLMEVAAQGVAELRTFATGLQRDYAAVKAGLTLRHSNGQTEAQIQRLKLLKRQMYGKAGFELLRKRVLYREPPYPVRPRDGQLLPLTTSPCSVAVA